MLKTLLIFAKLAITAAVIAGVIVLLAYEEHEAGDKYQRKCQSNINITSASSEHNASSTEQCQDAKKYMPWWHELVAWPEGITVWAILATLGAIGWQGWETRNAAQAGRDSARAALAQIEVMKKQERAQLVIRGLARPEISAPQSLLDGGSLLEVTAFVENVGRSKAFRVRAFGLLDITSNPKGGLHDVGFLQDFPQVIDEGDKKYPLNLGGFGREFEDIASTGNSLAITQELVEKLRNGKAFIKASGLLEYEDCFGDPHPTPFLFIWRSMGNDDGGKWLTRSHWLDCSTKPN